MTIFRIPYFDGQMHRIVALNLQTEIPRHVLRDIRRRAHALSRSRYEDLVAELTDKVSRGAISEDEVREWEPEQQRA